jgi:hypothetical protein
LRTGAQPNARNREIKIAICAGDTDSAALQLASGLCENAHAMAIQLALPLVMLPNLLPVLEGIYVYAQPPTTRPLSPGPYRALIDTGASHSWVKPDIGSSMQPHSLEGYVVRRGDGTEENAGIDVKSGFMKGVIGKPVTGWVQFEQRLPAIKQMLLCGEFDVPVDMVIGMDLLLFFPLCGVMVRGDRGQPFLAIEF